MAERTTRIGRCGCGAVNFEAELPDQYGVCHCGMCRRWAGGVFMAIGSRKVRFSAPENILRWQSSEWAERGSCRYCGSALFWRALGDDLHLMNVGALNDQSGLRMVQEVYVDEQPDHYRFESERERLTGQECRERHGGGAAESQGSDQ